MESYKNINRRPFYQQHWVLPIFLAIFLLPVLVLLPWQSQKIEFQDRQEQLIADSLWVEQGIRNLLNKDEDIIRILGEDIASHRIAVKEAHVRILALLEKHPEIQQIIWFDAKEQIRYSTAPVHFNDLSSASQQAIQLARNSSLPQYSQPASQSSVLHNNDQSMLMDYHYPLFNSGQFIGSILVSYKMSVILERVMPWWFARDHEVSIIDIDDNVVVGRVDTGAGSNVFTHNKSLDLPGVSLILRANSNKYFPRHFSTMLVSIVILLGIGLSWSLWALWRDILRRQAAEIALSTEMAFRKAMEKSLVTGLRVRSMDGRLVYVNAAFCDMVGYTEEQLIGQKYPFSYWSLEAFEDFSRDYAVSRASGALYGVETIYKHANGQKIPVLIYESALMDENGTQTGWMGAILDITERKRTEQILRDHEEKLHRNARLSTMGELASIMAHELNQPLTAINTYASGIVSMMQSGSLNAETIHPALTQMQKQAVRAAQIIHSVREFVAKRSSIRYAMQFEEVMQNVTPLIELQAKSFLVSLKIEVQAPLPDVYIDPIALEQVILNLTRNAFQSMQQLDLEKRVLRIIAKQADACVVVEVIDNGSGISADIAERLNVPFFSGNAEGLGMGLNICRTIIELHGGQLRFRANPSGGTIFNFTVPVADEKV